MRKAGLIAAVAMLLATTAATLAQTTEEAAAPIYGVKIPAGYREWTLVSVARVGTPLNDMRVKLGNDLAIRAFRSGKTQFPDGTIIARLAYKQTMSDEDNLAIRAVLEQVFGPEPTQKILSESFVAGDPTNVQFMIKDSRKYASTGGWG